MGSGSARLSIPVLAVLVFAALAALFGMRRSGWFGGESRSEAEMATTTAGPARQPVADGQPASRASSNVPSGGSNSSNSGAAPGGGQTQGAVAVGPAAPVAGVPRPGSVSAPPPIPGFDVVRVEPSGESVIAGRAAAGATVELLDRGTSLARAVADASGLFAFVPPGLAPGSHEISIQTIAPDGTRAQSTQSIAVLIAEDRRSTPLVTVQAPGQPSVVLSRPEEGGAPREVTTSGAPGAGPDGARTGTVRPDSPTDTSGAPASASRDVANARPAEVTPGTSAQSPAASARSVPPAVRAKVQIVSVETDAAAGRLYVSGSASPGATLRLYLNGAFVAPGSSAADGSTAFSIERGVKPGDYRVRLDDVDPVTGAVRSRAEVPFSIPSTAADVAENAPADAAVSPSPTGREPTAGPDAGGAAAPRAGTSPAAGSDGASKTGRVTSEGGGTRSASREGVVVVPSISTTQIFRGDNLWTISRRAYGEGLRYTVIYAANRDQIRDPDLIYPGQIFVLPRPGEKRK